VLWASQSTARVWGCYPTRSKRFSSVAVFANQRHWVRWAEVGLPASLQPHHPRHECWLSQRKARYGCTTTSHRPHHCALHEKQTNIWCAGQKQGALVARVASVSVNEYSSSLIYKFNDERNVSTRQTLSNDVNIRVWWFRGRTCQQRRTPATTSGFGGFEAALVNKGELQQQHQGLVVSRPHLSTKANSSNNKEIDL
jgi:hypothetical protein